MARKLRASDLKPLMKTFPSGKEGGVTLAVSRKFPSDFERIQGSKSDGIGPFRRPTTTSGEDLRE